MLLTVAGTGTAEIMRTAGVSKTAVRRWPERFMEEGVDGLLRDETRPARIAPLAPEVAARVVALTLENPRGETTHWTAEASTTTLVAALNVLDGPVIGRCMQRHRHQEFLRFLNQVEAQVPVGKIVHAIVELRQAQAPEGPRLGGPPS